MQGLTVHPPKEEISQFKCVASFLVPCKLYDLALTRFIQLIKPLINLLAPKWAPTNHFVV